ncbi:MAG TPA: LacI family DNA-binding transcriptional regulator [Streptosporangiaceae bacterium]|nr:LacI family DNA-binding transcriptional regulator [Streptosporangiaceae bacterium]
MSDQPVTLKDVAALAGVHPATVSRALNPETRLLVSDETADRILAAADSLGYRPNTVARSLRTRRSSTVGVLIPDLNNPLFPPIVRGIEDRLAADGYVALIGNTDADDERERLVFELMRDRHVDGFVFATARLRSPLLAEAAAARIPVVLVNRYAAGYGFPAVSVNNEEGLALSVAHLASLGHRRIAHVAGPQDISTGLSRYRGFVSAMAEHGLPVEPDLVVPASAYTIDEGERCCRELLGVHSGCTAIAAANDMLAVGCYAALESAGLSCPKDISVVGFNDMPFIDRLTPPLTSVSFAHYEVGTEAGRLILEQIASLGGAGVSRGAGALGGTAETGSAESVGPQGNRPPTDDGMVHYLKPELKVRGSTGPPAPMAGSRSSRSPDPMSR